MPQLYLTDDMKQWIFEAHDFYVAQINARIIAQFKDLEGDADRYAQAEYDRMGALPSWGEEDMGAIAELANDRAHEHYRLLSNLRESVILGALAGLYHQWEKRLRDFIEMELRHDMGFEQAAKLAWVHDIAKVFEFLRKLGWDVRSETFFQHIDACRLVVNVYKHGQGPSLVELNEKYPDYLPNPLGNENWLRGASQVHHDWLSVSEEGFAKIAEGLRSFWERFPERLELR